MKISASETQRDSSHLKTSLQHWFRFGNLEPERGIALLLGLEADDTQLAALADWGKDKKRDWEILTSGILMLSGNVLKLPPNPTLAPSKPLYREPYIAEEVERDFEERQVGYASTEAELDAFTAYMAAEEATFLKHRDQAEQEWLRRADEDMDDLEYVFGEIVMEYKKWLSYWESDLSIHPAAVGLSYYITWAKSKDFTPEWHRIAIKPEPTKQTYETPNIQEFERERLLKQVAALALVLAEKSNLYKRGENPNALQISTSVEAVLDEVPGANLKGLGKSNIRASIKEGLKLIA